MKSIRRIPCTVMLSPEMIELIEQAAKAAGLSRSTWMGDTCCISALSVKSKTKKTNSANKKSDVK